MKIFEDMITTDFDVVIESDSEGKIVKEVWGRNNNIPQKELDDPENEYIFDANTTTPICLRDLHDLVQRGVVIHGLPDWLIIK